MNIFSQPIQFQPVPLDEDELIRAIESQTAVNDDEWELTDATASDLNDYWASVAADSLQEDTKKI